MEAPRRTTVKKTLVRTMDSVKPSVIAILVCRETLPLRMQMRGLHNHLREKPSSVFMLLGWNMIFVASLCLDLLARILCHVAEYDSPGSYCDLPWLTSQVARVDGAP
jgi:hypothetical protein